MHGHPSLTWKSKAPLPWQKIRLVIPVYLGLAGLLCLLGGLPFEKALWPRNLAGLAPLVCALLLAVRLHHSLGPEEEEKTWNYLSAGFLLWAAGTLIEFVIRLVFPANSVSYHLGSLLRLSGYPAVAIGALSFLSRPRRLYDLLRISLDVLITSIGLIALVGLAFIAPALHGAQPSFSNLFWNVIFPVLDMILVIGTLNIALVNTLPDRRNTLSLLTAAWLLLAFTNSLSAVTILGGQPAGDPGWAIAWILGNGLLFYAVMEQSSTRAILPRWFRLFPARLKRLVQQSLPLAATAALLWYTLVTWPYHDGSINIAVAGLGLLCILLLILRQGIIAGESQLEQYAMLVNSVAEPAFILDEKGRFKLANPALIARSGLANPEDINRRPLTQLFPIDREELEWLLTALSSGWAGEIELHPKQGAAVPVYLSLQPFHRQGTRQVFLAGTAHDLSEQKRQQNALRQAHRQLKVLNENLEQKVDEKTRNLSEAYAQLEQQNLTLQKLDELKSDFVSLVSHELRAPLTNISGGIELILSSPGSLPDPAQQSLALVQAEVIRLNHFVKTILDVSALDAGKLPIYPAPISLEQTLEKFRHQFTSIPGSERVEWQVPTSLPFVLADENALASICFHLIDNALKYAPEGKIEVVVIPGGDCVTVAIDDEGPGIPKEALSLLFDKFYRLHKGDAQTVYGHGLGLYMVRRLLQAMNGEIQAANRSQGGSSFTFWLPAVQEKDEP